MIVCMDRCGRSSDVAMCVGRGQRCSFSEAAFEGMSSHVLGASRGLGVGSASRFEGIAAWGARHSHCRLTATGITKN